MAWELVISFKYTGEPDHTNILPEPLYLSPKYQCGLVEFCLHSSIGNKSLNSVDCLNILSNFTRNQSVNSRYYTSIGVIPPLWKTKKNLVFYAPNNINFQPTTAQKLEFIKLKFVDEEGSHVTFDKDTEIFLKIRFIETK